MKFHDLFPDSIGLVPVYFFLRKNMPGNKIDLFGIAVVMVYCDSICIFIDYSLY